MAAQRRAALQSNPASASSSTTTTLRSSLSHDRSTRMNILSSGTLRLRAEAGPSQATSSQSDRQIHWAEDVVNNEGMGKKSSKVCCIYHKQRAAGESSDESSSDSSSNEDSDAASDDGTAKPVGRRRLPHKHDHGRVDANEHHACDSGAAGDDDRAKGKAPRRAPNAYERVPKNT